MRDERKPPGGWSRGVGPRRGGRRAAGNSAESLAAFLAGGDNAARGRAAQRGAEAWLERRGYRVVARNWRSKVGEIDLLAFDGSTLCIIEVKARSRPDYGPAVAAVDRRKQRRIVRAARSLLAETGYRGPCRFDVLGLDRAADGWRFTLIRDAFHV